MLSEAGPHGKVQGFCLETYPSMSGLSAHGLKLAEAEADCSIQDPGGGIFLGFRQKALPFSSFFFFSLCFQGKLHLKLPTFIYLSQGQITMIILFFLPFLSNSSFAKAIYLLKLKSNLTGEQLL